MTEKTLEERREERAERRRKSAERNDERKELAKNRPGANTRRSTTTGRPPGPRLDPNLLPFARELAALGATDPEIAAAFQVTIGTVRYWRYSNPAFAAALKIGKDAADERVVCSLFSRAVGYSYDSEKIFLPKGSRNPVRVPTVEHVPPDVTACIFWLKNRRPDLWRDVQKHEHTGSEGGPIEVAHVRKTVMKQINDIAARLNAPNVIEGTAVPTPVPVPNK